jgi:hypothetical protein
MGRRGTHRGDEDEADDARVCNSGRRGRRGGEREALGDVGARREYGRQAKRRWARAGPPGSGGGNHPRAQHAGDARGRLGRPRTGGGWATRGGGGAAVGWVARSGGGKRREKGGFPFNLFSKCMISQIHPTNKIDAWSGMVQQPKDLTLGFYFHKMSS